MTLGQPLALQSHQAAGQLGAGPRVDQAFATRPGNLDILKRYGMDNESMEAIEGEVARMSRMVNDLLLLSFDPLRICFDSVLLLNDHLLGFVQRFGKGHRLRHSTSPMQG